MQEKDSELTCQEKNPVSPVSNLNASSFVSKFSIDIKLIPPYEYKCTRKKVIGPSPKGEARPRKKNKKTNQTKPAVCEPN